MATSKRSRTRSAATSVLASPSRISAPTDSPAAVTIADILADLIDKQARLTELIDAADPDDVRTLVRLFSLHAQNASRMGRLLRDQRALSGQAADGIAGAIAQALDELSSELGLPL
jgi:hypothetical protein